MNGPDDVQVDPPCCDHGIVDHRDGRDIPCTVCIECPSCLGDGGTPPSDAYERWAVGWTTCRRCGGTGRVPR